MTQTSTRRGHTQKVVLAERAILFTSPLAGEVAQSADEGVLKKKTCVNAPLTCPTGILSRKGRGKQHRGFTLIELLVVVLIIGILAAVALPQYQKAVDKTRYSTLMEIVTAVKNAEELFYLENGTYTTSLSQLSLRLPADCNTNGDCKNFSIWVDENRVVASLSTSPNNTLIYWFAHSSSIKNQRQCLARASQGERARRVCKSFGPRGSSTINGDCGGNCTSYRL